jgi:hypothetical protein
MSSVLAVPVHVGETVAGVSASPAKVSALAGPAVSSGAVAARRVAPVRPTVSAFPIVWLLPTIVLASELRTPLSSSTYR